MASYLGFRPSDQPGYYFLSYNTEDADRVGEIALQIKQTGIDLWYDKGIEYGEKWERTISEKIQGCQAVILFFTREILYKETPYVEKEYKMALNFERKIYVVMMDEIDHRDVPSDKMPWWIDIKALQCIEAHVIADPDRVVEEIISALAMRREQDKGTVRNGGANKELRSTENVNAPTSAITQYTAVHSQTKCLTPYLPAVLEAGLIGRDDAVERVRSMLDGDKRVVLLSGLGGIGKTAVMAKICNSIMTEGRKDTYVAWITCGDSLIDDLLILQQPLGVPKELERQAAYDSIVRKLQDLHGTLYLFLDAMKRVPDRKELGTYSALRARVRIMITSRHKIKGIPNVVLKGLDKKSAVDMFYVYYGKDRERKYEADAWRIINSDFVRSHTLLVVLLAKAAKVSFGSLTDFRHRFEKEGLLNVSNRKLNVGRFENKTIKEIVTQLYDVSSLTAEQLRIMRLFTIFTPEKVIYGAVEEWAGFDVDAVDGLVKFGWLDRGENGFIIHQVIRDSLAEQIGGSLRIEDYGDLLNRVIDTGDYMPRDLEYTEVQERLVLATDVARYLWTSVERLLEIGQHSEGDKKILKDSGTLFNNIALVYSDQGDSEKALEYYGKALAIIERVLGTEYPSMAKMYNYIAFMFRAQGRYEKALECYDKALGISERVLGTEHPSTATTYNNMASVYYAQGDYEKALEYYGKALAIRQRVLGPEHPSTATTYNNMAIVFRAKGDYLKAMEYYEKALVIYKKKLGETHPKTKSAQSSVQKMEQLIKRG